MRAEKATYRRIVLRTLSVVTLVITSLILLLVFTGCGENWKVDSEENITSSTEQTSKEIVDFEDIDDSEKEEQENARFLPVKVSMLKVNRENRSESSLTMSYNEASRLETIMFLLSNGEKVSVDYTYAYDEKGNVIKEVQTFGGMETVSEYTYDVNGNVLTESYFDGNVIETDDYTYDKNGNLLKHVNKGPLGESVSEYVYDEKGNAIKYVYTFHNITGTREWIYNEMGNVIKSVYTDSDDTKEIFEYNYDENGNLSKEVYTFFFGNQVCAYNYTYTYDANKRLVKYVCENSDGVVEDIWEYVYDDNGIMVEYIYTVGEQYKIVIKLEYELLQLPYEMSDEEYEDFVMYFINIMEESQ